MSVVEVKSRLVPVVFLLARDSADIVELVTIRRTTDLGSRAVSWWVFVNKPPRGFAPGYQMKATSPPFSHGPYDKPEEALAAFDAHEVEWLDGLGPYEKVST